MKQVLLTLIIVTGLLGLAKVSFVTPNMVHNLIVNK